MYIYIDIYIYLYLCLSVYLFCLSIDRSIDTNPEKDRAGSIHHSFSEVPIFAPREGSVKPLEEVGSDVAPPKWQCDMGSMWNMIIKVTSPQINMNIYK